MMIYGCVYKRSSKPSMKGSKVETIENARKNMQNYLKKVGIKLQYSRATFNGITLF